MAAQPFQVLAVCTMNICRSPAMEQQLAVQARHWELQGAGTVHVASAGTSATPGAPNCELTLGHLGVTDWQGFASALTPELLASSDLVLTAASDHVSQIIALNPAARSRVFTLRQAARLAQWITTGPALTTAVAKAEGAPVVPTYDDPHTLTEALPTEPADRLPWLVAELDAIRGTVPIVGGESEPDLDLGPDDIADPHVFGFELHQLAAELVGAAVADLGDSVRRILAVNLATVSSHG